MGLRKINQIVNETSKRKNLNEANIKVSFNLVDLENAILKFENGSLPPEHLMAFLRREMDKSLKRRQSRDDAQARKEQGHELIKVHARIVFAEAFKALNFDPNESSVASMIDNLASFFSSTRLHYPDADESEVARSAVISVWHASSADWRPILTKMKEYFEEKLSKVK